MGPSDPWQRARRRAGSTTRSPRSQESARGYLLGTAPSLMASRCSGFHPWGSPWGLPAHSQTSRPPPRRLVRSGHVVDEVLHAVAVAHGLVARLVERLPDVRCATSGFDRKVVAGRRPRDQTAGPLNSLLSCSSSTATFLPPEQHRVAHQATPPRLFGAPAPFPSALLYLLSVTLLPGRRRALSSWLLI